ncbi:MAG: hypothetical protein Q8O53_01305 [Candidatus Moranbacteria bacterium]|nr:hypothetical protein [Candidatus Moranbacteria bacterium]
MKFTTREIFGLVIVVGVGLFAAGSWQAFFVVARHYDVSTFLQTVAWFSLLGTIFFLGSVVWKELTLRVLGVLALVLPSLLFVHTLYHIGLVILSALLVLWGVSQVQGEIRDRLTFHFFRNVRAGLFWYIFGLSLVLASVYFASIERESWEELVTRFSIGEGTATVVFKSAAYLYPTWKNLIDEGLTVDGFLLSLEQEEAPAGITFPQVQDISMNEVLAMPAFGDYLKQVAPDGGVLSQELYLRSSRDQIARLVGRDVRGDEKIADVFSLAIQHKIIAVLSDQEVLRHISPTIVPFILAILLFLTLLPFGSLVGLLWMALSYLLFRSALFFGWLKLEPVEREQETLVH